MLFSIFKSGRIPARKPVFFARWRFCVPRSVSVCGLVVVKSSRSHWQPLWGPCCLQGQEVTCKGGNRPKCQSQCPLSFVLSKSSAIPVGPLLARGYLNGWEPALIAGVCPWLFVWSPHTHIVPFIARAACKGGLLGGLAGGTCKGSLPGALAEGACWSTSLLQVSLASFPCKSPWLVSLASPPCGPPFQ